MAKPFRILREKLPPGARKRAAEKTEAIIHDLPLNELRAARQLTQEQLAKSLGIEQRGAARRDALTGAGFMVELGSSWTDMIGLLATCPPLDMPKGLGRGYFLPGASLAG